MLVRSMHGNKPAPVALYGKFHACMSYGALQCTVRNFRTCRDSASADTRLYTRPLEKAEREVGLSRNTWGME